MTQMTEAAESRRLQARIEELEEMVEHQQGSSYMLGISSGWEQASGAVREKAGTYFKIGNDAAADLYRRLADELLQTSKERRKDYDEREAEYEKRLSDARFSQQEERGTK